MRVVPLEPPRRLSGDAGSALVEAAFLTPVVFYFLIAMLEMGLYFRNYLSTGAAATDAARTGSIMGKDITADFEILQAVRKATATMDTNQIVNLVVFDPANPASCQTGCTSTNPVNAQPPASCKDATVRTQNTTDDCNVYTPGVAPGGDWYTTSSVQYACTPPNNYSIGYCPTSRKTALIGTNGPPGFLGVSILVNHKYISKLFGTTKQIRVVSIASLEPQSLT